jgi:ERCC4-type nuclease
MVILVDTREQDTIRARKRLHDIGCQIERQKLDFGDYSVKCSRLDLSNLVAVERKMSIDEICACYGGQRKRFKAEFERCKAVGGKLYLLIENGSWERIYGGSYRSKMSPASLSASILAWLARYNCQIVFCEPDTSGKLIHDILYRELRERLMNLPDEEPQIQADSHS